MTAQAFCEETLSHFNSNWDVFLDGDPSTGVLVRQAIEKFGFSFTDFSFIRMGEYVCHLQNAIE